MRRCHYCSISA